LGTAIPKNDRVYGWRVSENNSSKFKSSMFKSTNTDDCTGRGRCGDFSGEHLTLPAYKTFTFASGDITSCARYANCYPGKSLRLHLTEPK